FEVTNANGELLFVMPFGEVLEACTVRNRGTSEQQDTSVALAASYRRALLVNRKMRDELDYAHSQLAESLAIIEPLRHPGYQMLTAPAPRNARAAAPSPRVPRFRS